MQAVETITSVSVELMERLRRQKLAKEQAAAAEQRREEAQRAAEAAEAEWRRLRADAEKLESEEAERNEAASARFGLAIHGTSHCFHTGQLAYGMHVRNLLCDNIRVVRYNDTCRRTEHIVVMCKA